MQTRFTAAALLAPIAAVLGVASPAFAATASERFADVPTEHWAERAVTFVAVDRGFMRGFPDGTFKGELPFTRVQLAMAIDELIRQLERQTGVSWEAEGLGGYEFQDLPADPEARDKILKLANKYRLFEGVPGVTSKTFEGQKQITRYEMARVIHRLMRLGENKKVVDPQLQGPLASTFSDLPRTAWAYNEVKEVADRYQVMVGFPDATFRGSEELTRYQFASTASQTFPLVVSLVDRTTGKRDQTERGLRSSGLRFQEDAPIVLAAGYQPTFGPGGMIRGVGYVGSVFGLAEVQGFVGTATGLQGTAAVGWAFPLTTGFHLQPYVGMRADSASSLSMGGLTYGGIAYWRPTAAFGIHLRAAGTSVIGDSSGTLQGTFLPQGSAGLWWHPIPHWSLFAEGGYGRGPNGVATTMVDAPHGLLGVGYGF